MNIFSNIAQSEYTHTEAMRGVLVKYNVADLISGDTIGVFTNTELQTLYNDLVVKGSVSLTETLIVGATIKDLNIRDLQVEIDTTDNADIALVYENLMRGSRDYLRSFMSQPKSRGGSYEPQYITASEFNQIVNSDKETGKHGNGGNGASGNQGSRRDWGQM